MLDETRLRQIVEGWPVTVAGRQHALTLLSARRNRVGDGAIIEVSIEGCGDRVLRLSVRDDTLADEKTFRHRVEHYATAVITGKLPNDAIDYT